jgi:hypothetical protein
MTKVRYTPTDDMPLTTTNLGYEFDARKATSVEDENILSVLRGHPHFEVAGEQEEPKKHPKPVAPAVPTLHAEETSRGKWSIFHGEDEIKSGLSKDDAEAFNAMSAEDRAEYIK